MSSLRPKYPRAARAPRRPKFAVLRRPWALGVLAVLIPLLGVLAIGSVFGPPAADAAEKAATKAYTATRNVIVDVLTPDPAKMPVVVPGSRTLKQPLLTVIAIDGSSSMADSDPNGQRWLDLKELRRWFVRNQSPLDEVALVKFSIEAISGPRVRITEPSAFARNSVVDPFAGGTNLVPPVNSAASLFAENPGAKACLILVTDGSSDDLREAQQAARKASDCPPLIIAMTKGDWKNVKNQWTSAKGFKVVPTGDMRPRAVAAIAARHVMQQVGQREAGGKGGH